MTRETYNWAVDTLLDAYNKGKLFHGDCNYCAVGNILGTAAWMRDFCTTNPTDLKQFSDLVFEDIGGIYLSNKELYNKSIVDEIDREYIKLNNKEERRLFLDNLYNKKGFNREELAKIEFTFETSIQDNLYDPESEQQFLGLTAVLKLMSTMVEEDTISEETINSNQERLVKVFEKVNVL